MACEASSNAKNELPCPMFSFGAVHLRALPVKVGELPAPTSSLDLAKTGYSYN